MNALAAFSLACNVLQVLDFGFNILKGSFYLAQPGEDSLPEIRTASALASDLRVLTAEIQSTSSSSGSDERLKILCAGCNELAQELIRVLDSLKVVKRRQLVAKAIQAQFEKNKILALERRLDGYRSEIHLYITARLSARVDVNAATQLDTFRALSADSQTSFLALLKAINDGTTQVMDRIDHQTSLMETLHQNSNQDIVTEAEQTRQQLAVESAQSRLEIISNLQDKIDRSTNNVASQLDDSASQIKAANAATQHVLAQTIKMSEQTVQDDISRLRQSLLLVSQQISSTEAKLNQIILQLDQSKRNVKHRKTLQIEGTRLTKFLLSLKALYAEFQRILTSLLGQARSLLGPLQLKDLINQGSTADSSAIQLAKVQRQLDPNAYLMLTPIVQGSAAVQFVSGEVLVRYYHYYYLPLLPPLSSLLDMSKLKRNRRILSHTLSKGVFGEIQAVTELACSGNRFVWLMALLVGVLDTHLGEARCEAIIRTVFVVIDDSGMVSQLCGTCDNYAMPLPMLLHIIADAVTKLFATHLLNAEGLLGRKFGSETLLGVKLGEDLALWRMVAGMSALRQRVRDRARDDVNSILLQNESNPSGEVSGRDVQVASLLVCVIMMNRMDKRLAMTYDPNAPPNLELPGTPGRFETKWSEAVGKYLNKEAEYSQRLADSVDPPDYFWFLSISDPVVFAVAELLVEVQFANNWFRMLDTSELERLGSNHQIEYYARRDGDGCSQGKWKDRDPDAAFDRKGTTLKHDLLVLSGAI